MIKEVGIVISGLGIIISKSLIWEIAWLAIWTGLFWIGKKNSKIKIRKIRKQ